MSVILYDSSLSRNMRSSSVEIAPSRTIINFPGQYYGEEVILLTRRSFLHFYFTFALFLVLLTGPFVLWGVGSLALGMNMLSTSGTSILFIIGSVVYYLMLLQSLLLYWMDYYFDVTIVTDRRVIDITQTGLTRRSVSESNLVDIKESYVEQNGFWANMFNHGDVFVQVPATKQNIIIQDVENPREVARIINDLHNQAIQGDPDKGENPEPHQPHPPTPAPPQPEQLLVPHTAL